MNEEETINLDEFHQAANHLRSLSFSITPVLTNSILNTITKRNIYLKCENFQRTGSFKTRGAVNAVLNAIKRDSNIKGFVTRSSKNKMDAIQHYGAEIVFCEPTPTGQTTISLQISQERDFLFIPPSDHRDIIAGQETIALELLEQVPNLDAILVSVSSGGLISGVAIYAKYINPNIRIYACVPEGKMLEECLKEEKRLWPEPPQFLQTKCEACRSQQCGKLTFPIICSLVEKQVFNISDQAMIDATRFAFEQLKLVIELAAGLPLAAILSQIDRLDSAIHNIGIILCGGNIDFNQPLPWHG